MGKNALRMKVRSDVVILVICWRKNKLGRCGAAQIECFIFTVEGEISALAVS